jgi:HipA-like protein
VPLHGNGWNPNTITRAVQGYATATRTVRVDTDHGEGFLKALGNPEGPHALACELVGSLAADWLGLKTFDFSIIEVTDPEEVAFDGQSWAQPGPAFISRAEDMGFTWGGDPQMISAISNRKDITRLVLLDTWLRNCDRRSPDGSRINLSNVFLVQRSHPQRILELFAMDFTHAFTCGSPLDRRLGHIERVQDAAIFGRFPEFDALISRDEAVACAARLGDFDAATAQRFIAHVPLEWQVDSDVRAAWKRFLVDRAHFTADTIAERLWPKTDELTF